MQYSMFEHILGQIVHSKVLLINLEYVPIRLTYSYLKWIQVVKH